MALLKKLLPLFLLALLSPLASASPTFLYGFTILSFSCDNHPYINCPDGAVSVPNWSQPLANMTVGVSADAFSGGQASLLINDLGTYGNIANDGIASFNPTRWNMGGGELNLDESALTGPPVWYKLNAFFSVSRYLTGKIYINDTLDELYMSTTDSTLWSGFIRSDELGLTSSVLNFTGEWRLIWAVPEPGTLGLWLCAALVAAAVGQKRRRDRQP